MRCPLTLWDFVEFRPGRGRVESRGVRGRLSEILDAGQAPTQESLSGSCQAHPQIRPTAPATTLPHSSLRTSCRTPIRSRHVLCSRSAQFHDFQESQSATHPISVSHRSPIVCACLSNYRVRRSSSNIQEYLIARSSEKLKKKFAIELDGHLNDPLLASRFASSLITLYPSLATHMADSEGIRWRIVESSNFFVGGPY